MANARRELDELPRCPAPMFYLWQWYLQLRRRCTSSGMGIADFTWQDLEAWERRTGNRLEAFELIVFERFDAEMLRVYAKKQQANAPAK